MDVSVIIVNFRTPQLVLDCVDSIFRYTKDVTFEIIVVDNNSGDNSASILSSDLRFKYVQSPNNVGFGGANNLGYKYSTGKYIFLLNPDTILLNNAIKIFFDEMEMLPMNVSCIGCRLLDKERNITKSIGIWQEFSKKECLKLAFLSYFPAIKNKYIEKAKNNYGLLNKNVPFIPVDIIIGADMFIRNSVIKKCGLFDPRFFMYSEESDMQKTFKKNGYISGIIQGPQIVHLEGKSAPSSKRILMSTSGMFVYQKKWSNPFSYSIYRFMFFILRFPLTILNRKRNVKYKLEYLKLLLQPAKNRTDFHL